MTNPKEADRSSVLNRIECYVVLFSFSLEAQLYMSHAFSPHGAEVPNWCISTPSPLFLLLRSVIQEFSVGGHMPVRRTAQVDAIDAGCHVNRCTTPLAVESGA